MQPSRALCLLLSAMAFGPIGGCEDDADEGHDDATGGAEDGGEAVPLSATDALIRISMALRGTRPALAELEAVEADPAALAGLVDAYLEAPEFGATVRDLHNDALLLLVDYAYYPAGFPGLDPLAGVDGYRLNRSIMEAPLRTIEHVVMEDRPYSEIVTADYAWADGIVAAVWGLPYRGDGTSWEETTWSDGRPGAGILSNPWMWQRHSSTLSNANRGRANAVSRALLCWDFLDRDIDIDSAIDLSDPAVVADAVEKNTACAGCHQSLDPLAAYFGDMYPIIVPSDIETYPEQTYYPGLFERVGVPLRAPSFFGTTAIGLDGLGAAIAADPRFSACAARRFYAYFHQVDLEAVPFETAAALQKAFVDSGLDAKALTRAIVLDPEFLASHRKGEADADDRVGLKRARPEQLGRLFEDLAGFSWRSDLRGVASQVDLGVVDLMEDSFLGFKVLSGGIDAIYNTRPSYTSSATTSLVLRSLAREAANAVVERDFAEPDRGARLLLDALEAADAEAFRIRDQLVRLHRRLYGEILDDGDPQIDAGLALWQGAFDLSGSSRRAWKVTLTALFQDVRIAHY